jgi:hypothetical protein
MFLRSSATGPACCGISRKPAALSCTRIATLFALLGFLCSGPALFAQCAIQAETVARVSADALGFTVQGTCSRDCREITVHWINPGLPDKTTAVSLSPDASQPGTWSVPYSSADGLTLSMLLNNFPCGSTNFSVEVSCTNVPGCQANISAGALAVACKETAALCSIQDTDLHCGNNGRLTAETSVSSTGSENVSVALAVTRDGQNVASASLTDNDGFITVSEDFDFAAGSYSVTTTVDSPPSCAQTRTTTFTITNDQCASPASSPTPTAPTTPTQPVTPVPDPPGGNNTACPECEFCGGEWSCCIAWIFIFIGLFLLIATILYLICDPTGGGGWGWLVLAIAAVIFGLALWWIIVHCQFDVCRFLEILTLAATVDLVMVCAIQGLFPCFSAVICGLTVIGGVQIRNWFFILMAGALIILGIEVLCPFR